MSPQGTTDEAFQAYEPIEELTNVTFFSLLICFLCGTRARASLKMGEKHFN